MIYQHAGLFFERNSLRTGSVIIENASEKFERIMSDSFYTPFTAEILKHPDMNASYIRIPFNLKKQTGKGRLRVLATFDDVPYDGTIVNMGEKNPDGSICYLLGMPQAIRKLTGKTFGDKVEVVLTPWTEPSPEAFFAEEPGALPLFMELNERILEECGVYATVRREFQKTQVSYYNARLFACISLLRIKRKAEMPHPYITVTFGLGMPCRHPRIGVVTEVAPNRWTHHVSVSSVDEIDDQLMGWLKEAAEFSISHQRGKL